MSTEANNYADLNTSTLATGAHLSIVTSIMAQPINTNNGRALLNSSIGQSFAIKLQKNKYMLWKTMVMDYTASTDLWKALEKLYSAHSKLRMNATRTHIQTNKKGKSIMEEDLKQMKSWVGVLAIVRNPYLELQLVANMLFGLDREYMHIEFS
ncbi:hypothetical protein Patl1_20865 [Pistacia atlantica]|uniref:Uncharacterized protein n=1 Tax=Pistacia atlantica TaxID=434234 RepID=A0ACC1BNS4_9ROSI|nr:hypothetical protein Patl1_20865 [Pistacia atlantica]